MSLTAFGKLSSENACFLPAMVLCCIVSIKLSNYSTRNYLDLDIPRQNLEFSKKSIFYCGAQVWNEIPLQMRTSSTITTSKMKLEE